MTLPQRVAHIVKHGMAVLHPCVYGELGSKGAVDEIVKDIEREISLIMPGADAAGLARRFADSLPEVRKLVETDIDAAYDGDPAATSRVEVVMAYPGLYAVTVHRLAHVLYTLGVPVLPRVMSELAHSKTGIDIHPGATIGPRFFIDHGTGVVIGETTVIGSNVRHRPERAPLPGRDARRAFFREGCERRACQGAQAPSEHRRQRRRLRERHHSRGRDDHRPRF